MSRMFIYIEGVLHSISCAGRALAGWRDSHTNVFQPECCFITQSNDTQVMVRTGPRTEDGGFDG